eukprot:5815179-Amphidinium_carterae.1
MDLRMVPRHVVSELLVLFRNWDGAMECDAAAFAPLGSSSCLGSLARALALYVAMLPLRGPFSVLGEAYANADRLPLHK